MDKRFVGFLALAGGLAVFAEIFLHVSKFPLDIIGAGIAVVAGLLGLFAKY
jgi:hypothetical protein